jgi:DNA-binding CsgD family transcriptional regulator
VRVETEEAGYSERLTRYMLLDFFASAPTCSLFVNSGMFPMLGVGARFRQRSGARSTRDGSETPPRMRRHVVSICGTPLSTRECEIVVLICNGLGIRETAFRLGISHHTAIEHLKRTYLKLGFTNQIQLVRYAIRTGMIEA